MIMLRFNGRPIDPNDVVSVGESYGTTYCKTIDDWNLEVKCDREFVQEAIELFRFRALIAEIGANEGEITVRTGSMESHFSTMAQAANEIAKLQAEIEELQKHEPDHKP